MGYVESNLMKGEKVIYHTKLHWIIFMWPAVFLATGLWVFTAGRDGLVVGTLFVILCIITGLVSLINIQTSEFAITNKRVIAKTGLIRRTSLEVLLGKVESIGVDQGILGRIFDYGSIVVSGTGGARDPFKKIERPMEFRRKAQEQIEALS